MTETIITVQGEHSAWYPAERATVRAGVHAWGAERDVAFADAVGASDAIRALIEPLVAAIGGPITWWSSDSVRVWSERPWNSEGLQLDPVFHAAVDFTAKFSNFDALARWVESVAAVEHANVGSIEWSLTDATRTSATVEVRSRAVKDAVAKATVFAQSIGLGTLTATALADPGMLGDPSGSRHGDAMPRGAMMKASADYANMPQLALKPEEIAVISVVDARFVAS